MGKLATARDDIACFYNQKGWPISTKMKYLNHHLEQGVFKQSIKFYF